MKQLSAKEIKKAILDTFKPYKHNNQIIRDFLQPLKGIGNLVLGLLCLAVMALLIACPISMLVSLVAPVILAFMLGLKVMGILSILILGVAGITSWVLFSKDLKDMYSECKVLFKSLCQGLEGFPRGFIQTITSPLLLITIPFRFILTYVFGAPSIVENKGLQRNIACFDQAGNDDCFKFFKSGARDDIRNKLVTYYKNGQKDADKFVNRDHTLVHGTVDKTIPELKKLKPSK